MLMLRCIVFRRSCCRASAPRVAIPSAMSLSLVCLAFIGIFSQAVLAEGGKFAFVVANSAYTHTPVLKNPLNDADRIADALTALGFEVHRASNTSAVAFSTELDSFVKKIRRESTVLFYYAGHGIQVFNQNYLVGTDARLLGAARFKYELFKLDDVIAHLEQNARTIFMFWDACRDNPLLDNLKQALERSGVANADAVVRQGAARVSARSSDALIMFSAEAGRKALDGSGDYSPFATALYNHIRTPNLSILSMLTRVTAEVSNATSDYQRPETVSRLRTDFYFNPKTKVAVAQQAETEQLYSEMRQLRAANRIRSRFSIRPASQDVSVVRGVGGDGELETGANPPPREPSALGLTRGSNVSNTETAEAPAAGLSEIEAPKLRVLDETSVVIRRVKFSPDGAIIAVAGDDGIIRFIDAKKNSVMRSWKAHEGRVRDISFSSDSGLLASVGNDKALRIWNLSDRTKKAEFKVEGDIPYSVAINPMFSRFVLVGRKDGYINAWDLQRNKRITNRKLHTGPVLSVAYQPNGKGTYMTTGGDGYLKIRFPKGRREQHKIHNRPVFDMAFDPSGHNVITTGKDRVLKKWDIAKKLSDSGDFKGHLRYVLSVDISPDGKKIVSGGADKFALVWSTETQRPIGQLEGHAGDVEDVAFSPNGKFIVSSSEDRSVRVWSGEYFEPILQFYFEPNSEKFVGLTQDGRYFGNQESKLVEFRDEQEQIGGRKSGTPLRDQLFIARGVLIEQQ